MPRELSTPVTTCSIDRLSLAISTPRGSVESAVQGQCGFGCMMCMCAEVGSDTGEASQPAAFCPCGPGVVCFNAED